MKPTFSIRAAIRRLGNRCPSTGAIIDPTTKWAVFMNSYALAPSAARKLAPDLSNLLPLLGDAEPVGGERKLYAIVARVPGRNTLCPIAGHPITPRDFEVAMCPESDVGKYLSVAAGEDEAPALAAALHTHFQTKPAERLAPPTPPPETDEKREARERRETIEAAMKMIARALDTRGDVHPDSVARATDLVAGIKSILAA